MVVTARRLLDAGVFIAAAATTLLPIAAYAQDLAADPAAIAKITATLKATKSTEAPAIYKTDEGFIRYLGAPSNGMFATGADKSATPADTAIGFVNQHKGAFGQDSTALSYKMEKTHTLDGRDVVRTAQTYNGLEVFGAAAVVVLDQNKQVRHLIADVLRDLRALENGDTSLIPRILPEEAIEAARNHIASIYKEIGAPQLQVTLAPEPVLYSPGVVGLDGPAVLAWRLQLAAISPRRIREEVLVDSQSGQAVFHHSLLHSAIDRQVFDLALGLGDLSIPARQEGDPPVGIDDVDDTFEFLEDVYNFFLDNHGWRSYDGQDSTLVATVRLPIANAFFDADDTLGTFYGVGWATDDVVAHEIAHGFTQFSSDLIYFGFSGAINESMSDIWGEYVDLTNSSGNDAATVRWLVGEDIPEFADDPQTTPGDEEGEIEGEGEGEGEGEVEGEEEGEEEDLPPGIRSMQDPTIFGHPDRLTSEELFDISSFFDNGGVHINSGIGNKLAYLLTDGGAFNGHTVEGLGIPRTADLYFAAQFLLTPSADYSDLYFALRSTARDLGFTEVELENIDSAARAVEIAPELPEVLDVQDFRATPTRDQSGAAVILLTWAVPEDIQNITILRSLTGFATSVAEGVIVYSGRDTHFIDRSVTEGTRYYYTLIGQLQDEEVPRLLFASAVAGAEATPPLTESFGVDPLTGQISEDFDLSFTQIMFHPTGAPDAPIDGFPRGGDFSNYTVSVTPGVFDLPIPREDGNGEGGQTIVFTNDDFVFFSTDTGYQIPVFGIGRSNFVISANGYISFVPIGATEYRNFPSLIGHYSLPRIAFLFTDLAFNIGGTAWRRTLEDRHVVTFENVPENRSGSFTPPPNTVQVELFFSGHIRITYGSVGADNVIVGISDGRGAPVNPAEIDPALESLGTAIDFSELPTEPQLLTFEPLPRFSVHAGQPIEITVRTAGVQAGEGTPILTATWSEETGVAPFADNGDGTGRFVWTPEIDEEGITTVRVEARLGTERAYIDIRIVILDAVTLPEARNLGISTGTPLEDPTQSRAVDTNRPLIAQYEYFHPQMNEDRAFTEGQTTLLWFRNGELIPSLTNAREVSANLTHGGDQWHFRVTPIAFNFTVGSEAISPLVYIAGYPEVLSITPPFGSIGGGETVRIRGMRFDGITEITFGGVKSPSVRAVGGDQLDVVTPPYPPGQVDVVVRNTQGSGLLAGGFTYIITAADLEEDVNNDGKVDSLDVQLVVSAIIGYGAGKQGTSPDVNGDGQVNSGDLQRVVNAALIR